MNEKYVKKYDDDDIVKLNIGGKYFETYYGTIFKYPESKLFRYVHSSFFDMESVNFFDRNYQAFGSILDFLRTGRLIKPSTNFPIQILQEELKFWEYPEYTEDKELEGMIDSIVSSRLPSSISRAVKIDKDNLKLLMIKTFARRNELKSILTSMDFGDSLMNKIKKSYEEELMTYPLKILQLEVLNVYKTIDYIVIEPKILRSGKIQRELESFLKKIYDKIDLVEKEKEDRAFSYKTYNFLLLEKDKYDNTVFWSVQDVVKYCRYHNNKSSVIVDGIPTCQNCKYKYSYCMYDLHPKTETERRSIDIKK